MHPIVDAHAGRRGSAYRCPDAIQIKMLASTAERQHLVRDDIVAVE
jgi:hypothetical protein